MKVGDKVTLKAGSVSSSGYVINYEQSNRTVMQIAGDSIKLEGDINWFWKKDVLIEKAPQTDSIVESVINQFKQRSEAGINKYGTTLDRNDLSTLEWIEHAKQEAMDFILYLEKLKQELK